MAALLPPRIALRALDSHLDREGGGYAGLLEQQIQLRRRDGARDGDARRLLHRSHHKFCTHTLERFSARLRDLDLRAEHNSRNARRAANFQTIRTARRCSIS